MDAAKIWMLSDFIGTNKVVFKIPVYQRNYDWSESNCNKLLDDIKDIIDTSNKHFLGTVVFMSEKDGGFALKEYTIIDGQQRLTTMMLLLKALADVAKDIDTDCYDEIQDSYLHNHHCSEEFKVKLKPIKFDNDQFVALLKDQYDLINQNSNIYKNYKICKDRIQKWVDAGKTFVEIHNALLKLEIVQIVLTKGEDDPQIIFESINSTGLELSNADLIRNFLLMNAADQEDLFENYWLYIENALKRDNDYSNLNQFFMHYTIYKTSVPLNMDKLYNRFVLLFKEQQFTQESCLKELKFYADIFKAFVYDESKYSEKVRRILKGLRQLKQTTCYPFMLHVFADFENGIITEEELTSVLKLIHSYLLRRILCGVPSNSLRGFFIYLYNRVFKVETNKKKYYQSINKFLFGITSKDAFPSDAELLNVLKTANVYSNIYACKFLLADIENGDNKENINTDALTIEHIMPQTLSADWKHIADDEHEQFLHVLGNLSVTGYNSELSNKSFSEKKKIIIAHSKAVVLNADVWNKDSWTIDDIKARGSRLADIVLNRYHIDEVDDPSIEFEYLSKIGLDDFSKVTGKKLVSFCFECEYYRQSKYALMLIDVMRLIDQKDPTKFEKLANDNFSFGSTKQKHTHISYDPSNMRIPYEIRDGIYIESNLSAVSVLKFIDAMFNQFGLDKSDFYIQIVSENEETDDLMEE